MVLAHRVALSTSEAIVDCIISIIEENAESKETGLSHLCEFIEDCESTVLATRILHPRPGGAQDQQPLQVHPLHLQPRGAGARGVSAQVRARRGPRGLQA